jgi:ribosomal protein S12 methylthiotransferase accessory factor YcaO
VTGAGRPASISAAAEALERSFAEMQPAITTAVSKHEAGMDRSGAKTNDVILAIFCDSAILTFVKFMDAFVKPL